MQDFPEERIAWPAGYLVCKSSSVKGNGHDSYDFMFDGNSVKMKSDSPAIVIWNKDGKTHIEVSEYVPGPGPSDFIESFETEYDAVERILRYFFDPNDPKFKIWHDECEKMFNKRIVSANKPLN